MRILTDLVAAILVWGLAALPTISRAQESSLGTYSPYTMYGLGNLNRSPISGFVGMGGASIGFRNVFADESGNGGFETTADLRLNVANPASLSAIPKRTFTFDVGLAGSNVYLMQRNPTLGTLRTSFNTFNFNNITIALPIAGKLGLALSVAPYSEVGYKVHTDDESYLADLGVVRYFYDGQGAVNEAKAALGWEPFRGVSLGAEINYLWGNIDRTYQATILPYTGSGQYNTISATTNEHVSRAFGAFGLQITPVSSTKTRLTLGATYRLGGTLNSDVTDFIPSGNIYDDVIRLDEFTSPTRMPQKIGAGFYFHRLRWAVGADYVFEDWSRGNPYDAKNSVRYVDANTLKIGARYTPDRYDIRSRTGSFFNRVTYKAGVRTGGSYLEFRGEPMRERAVTLGLDIPFRAANVSTVSLGLEYGERGTLRQNLVKERYFKVNVGIMLFGRDYDYWFEKYKYN
ncbi:MAG: hypothetical protein LBU97_04350 [Alistipes sp.]|jgi:hypothetical protein|nr:hypothetical protein [Alistipes sp.]